MSTVRMTQGMMNRQAQTGLQAGLNRLAKVQEQLATGRVLNRPSDDPTAATSAMRIRASVADQRQFVRNANDGLGWLNQADSTLSSVTDQVRRAYEIALQGANTGSMGAEAREALATEVDQIRQGLVSTSNAAYLNRPVFGGVTAGTVAYAADPITGVVTYQPTAVTTDGVVRAVSDGATVRVDVEGPDVFGADGNSIFDHLADLSSALRSGSSAGISGSVGVLGADRERVTNVQADIGARTKRVEQARDAASDAELRLTSSLSEVENTDLVKASVDLKLQEVAYQAALSATARVMQPSLLDFLR
ncbi:flagellin N-terminal helical domain-containing protein [Nocardioides sp. T2.26MG-1]|uniref:flagellin N-terminal helical domain-containing protein n=1 Tax=Nocardioides sp. T2.26MG-1 TaxID=3041166 RepID=UPI00253FCE7C|nr:flagellin [Nocardioides sp. T2.26MG-1]